MAILKSRYTCQACGSVQHRWQGQCPDCAEWHRLLEEASSVRNTLPNRQDADTPALMGRVTDHPIHSDCIEAAPSTVSQFRAWAQELVRFPKEHLTAVVFVGHAANERTSRGPCVL